MKKKCKILCSILFYILLLSWAIDFQFVKLLDVKLLLQHVIGTMILTLPFCHKKMTKEEYGFCFFLLLKKQEEALIQQDAQKEPTRKVNYEHFLEIGLTKREAEIAILISKGLSNREIAEEFVISEATVKKHVSNIFEKTGIEKREQIKNL